MTPRELAERLAPLCQWLHDGTPWHPTDKVVATIEAAFAQVATKARREALGEAMAASRNIPACPFDRKNHDIKPEQPCPVCGDLGTFESTDRPSRCETPYAAIRALLDAPVPPAPTRPTPDFPPWSREMAALLRYMAAAWCAGPDFQRLRDAAFPEV